MPDLFQFVDSISATPTVRLNLSSAPWIVHRDTRLGPPPMKRSVTSTMLRDGEYVGSTAYGNRELQMMLLLDLDGNDAIATELQKLARELDRPTNIVKWQPEGATNPVFFRTFRSSPDSIIHDPGLRTVNVTIQAEPFALGQRVDVGTVTVNQDPAAGSNGCFLDVTSVKGDVETPLLLTYAAVSNGSGGFGFPSLNVAVRSGGTYPTLFRQAESLTLGTDTTSVAVAGNSGGSVARISFATNNTLTVPRISGTFPTGTLPAGAESRGIYRVFLRVTASGNQTFSVSTDIGATSVSFLAQALPSIVEVGTWSVQNFQPQSFGYESTAAGVSFLPTMDLYFSRATAAQTLDVDYVMLIPVDYRYGTFRGTGANASTDLEVIDGPADAIYIAATAPFTTPRVSTAVIPPRTGVMPMVKPGDNRVYILETAAVPATGTLITDTVSVSAYYWPRYVHVRPAST